MNMASVWIFSEQRGALLELVGEGRRLAEARGATLVAVVPEDRALAEDALSHGADEAVVLKQEAGQPLEAAAGTLAELISAADADVVLFSASLRGSDLAARVAARLGVALASSVTALRSEADGRLETTRMVFGGAGVSTQVTRPQMATVAPRTFPAPAPGPSRGATRTVPVPADARVKVTARRPRGAQGADIAQAPVVVAVGRGLAKQEDVKQVEELARALGGAVGCTRPIAEDLRWLPEESYIGISGRKVAPRLYLALGLSGQVQHLAGMRDSKVVVAINKDEKAPIFHNADYGLVGDLESTLPALRAEVAKLLR
jgi:electron transfer flavoprotein alpha subunit